MHLSSFCSRRFQYDYVVYNWSKTCFLLPNKKCHAVNNQIFIRHLSLEGLCAERNSTRLWWIIQGKCALVTCEKVAHPTSVSEWEIARQFWSRTTQKHTGGSCCRHDTHTCVAGRDIANYLLAERLNYQLQLLSSLCINEFSGSRRSEPTEKHESFN